MFKDTKEYYEMHVHAINLSSLLGNEIKEDNEERKVKT